MRLPSSSRGPLSSDAHQELLAAMCVAFSAMKRPRLRFPTCPFRLGRLREARVSSTSWEVFFFFKGHFPFPEHLPSSWNTLYSLGTMNHVCTPMPSPFSCTNVFLEKKKEITYLISLLGSKFFRQLVFLSFLDRSLSCVRAL